MRLLKTHTLLRFVNSYLVDSPQPANISYLWNFGSLLALCLGIQILTGAFLAMHYTPNVDFAFNSVEHIMRDVNNGWIIRYTHANVASFFFIFVYMHIGRGLYFSSYKTPRVLVWSIGVIIFILMIAIAFLGYVLPYGQMSLWGKLFYALHDCSFFNIESNHLVYNLILPINPIVSSYLMDSSKIKLFHGQPNLSYLPTSRQERIHKLKSNQRIGPHNYEVLSILIGSLLGDAYAEKHGNGTRICFQQEKLNSSYLLWFYNFLSERGYCNKTIPKITTRIGKKGKLRYLSRFKTYTYSSLN